MWLLKCIESSITLRRIFIDQPRSTWHSNKLASFSLLSLSATSPDHRASAARRRCIRCVSESLANLPIRGTVTFRGGDSYIASRAVTIPLGGHRDFRSSRSSMVTFRAPLRDRFWIICAGRESLVAVGRSRRDIRNIKNWSSNVSERNTERDRAERFSPPPRHLEKNFAGGTTTLHRRARELTRKIWRELSTDCARGRFIIRRTRSRRARRKAEEERKRDESESRWRKKKDGEARGGEHMCSARPPWWGWMMKQAASIDTSCVVSVECLSGHLRKNVCR